MEKNTITVYLLAAKQVPSSDDPNGTFTLEIYGSYEEALREAHAWCENAPSVTLRHYMGGILFEVAPEDRIDDAGLAYVHLTPHKIHVELQAENKTNRIH